MADNFAHDISVLLISKLTSSLLARKKFDESMIIKLAELLVSYKLFCPDISAAIG
jgi:hypothetical protein